MAEAHQDRSRRYRSGVHWNAIVAYADRASSVPRTSTGVSTTRPLWLNTNVWTWSGKYFGYLDGEDLWTWDGRHLGKRAGDEIYGSNGAYLGELTDNRIRVAISKKGRMRYAFEPAAARPSRALQAARTRYARCKDFEDFPAPESASWPR